jgi:murein DD-endopeptidase MepM/ murein hydrolase activator NlpD
LRNGRWNQSIPSIQRTIDAVGGIVDRLIVAQGLSPEKLIAHTDPLTPAQRGVATLLQVTLACACVVLIWLNWPDSAAAPITVDRTVTASAAANLLESSVTDSTVTGNAVTNTTEAVAEDKELPATELPGEAQAAPVVLIGEQPGAKPDVETVLAQVTANTGDDTSELSDDTPALSEESMAPSASQVLAEVPPDAAQVDPADLTLAEPEAGAPGTILSQLETAIAKAIEEAASNTENAPLDNLVVVEPQVQPKSEEPVAETAASSSRYPYAMVLGPVWDSFTPLSPEEVDHYWLGVAFPPGYNQFYSPSYQFGSTAGGRYRPHHGVDISNPLGTPVISMAGGEVIHAGPDNPTLLGPYNNFYGNSVVVRLDRTLTTPEGEKEVFLLYGQLNEVFAERGQRINPGDSVGTVGMTGIAIGPHLHVEIRVGQNSYMTAVNPVLWMQPPSGTGAVAIRLVNAQGQSWSGARVSLLRYEGEGARWVRTVETYRSEEPLRGNPLWGENGAESNLTAGAYYIAAEVNGEKVGLNIVIEDGKTTFVELRTQQ